MCEHNNVVWICKTKLQCIFAGQSLAWNILWSVGRGTPPNTFKWCFYKFWVEKQGCDALFE